jgi:hypothetical protein
MNKTEPMIAMRFFLDLMAYCRELEDALRPFAAPQLAGKRVLLREEDVIKASRLLQTGRPPAPP